MENLPARQTVGMTPGASSLRASDDDRQRAVEFLRVHTTEGRLTLDEFGDRISEVYAAVTLGDLALTVRDLPALNEPVPEAERIKESRSSFSLFGASDKTGRWRIARRYRGVAVMGEFTLDLRNVEFDGDELVIKAVSIMGAVKVIVPEGVEVALDGFSLMGARTLKLADVPKIPGTPLVRVRAYAVMGAVEVVSKAAPEVERQRKLERARQRDRKLDRRLSKQERRQAHHDRHMHRRAQHQGASASPFPQVGDGTVTLLFSDIEGSTALAEIRGDARYVDAVRAHTGIVRSNVAAAGGREVKSEGDGFMGAFASARQAIRAGVAVQHAIAAHNRERPDDGFAVRIGIHTGEAVHDAGDLHGRNVVIASRIADAATPGEVLVSDVTRALVIGAEDIRFAKMRDVELKGIDGLLTVHAIDLDPA